MAKESSSGVISSRLQASSIISSPSFAVSPINALTTFAHSKFFLPVPQPAFSIFIVGMATNSDTKYLSSAAPVGVHSSDFICLEYIGTPRRISSVAGAGTFTSDASIRSGASSCMSVHTLSTSASASRDPTSWKCTFSIGCPWTRLSASAMME